MGRRVSAIEPSGIGVRTISVQFSGSVTFDEGDVIVERVEFPNGVEHAIAVLTPASVGGSGTNMMMIGFPTASVVDTWVKVTLTASGIRDASNQPLDGEPRSPGSGLGYIYNSALDLPTGDGVPAGDAIFYVGSLRGDFNGDRLVTEEDMDAFMAKYQAGDLDADFRGVGFSANEPDGQITPSDFDGFISVYEAAKAENRHLDPLPTRWPVANDDTFAVRQDSGPNTLNVLANDSDPDGDALTIIAKTDGMDGTVAIGGGGTSLIYTPHPGFQGADHFTYTVSDGRGGTATAGVTVTVVAPPPRVLSVSLNGRPDRSVSAVEPSGIGVRTIKVQFSGPVTFDEGDVVVEKVEFPNGVEQATAPLTPASIAGSGTNVMTISFATASVVDTWVKVTLIASGIWDALNQALDGEPRSLGSGRGYIYSAALDLPTGDGMPGGDAVFCVGSLRGDFDGDGLVTEDDMDAFMAKYEAGNLDADFRGAGFVADEPDGQITQSDFDGFLSVYEAAMAEDRHLDPLPTSLAP
jgi:hypothetical protein